MTPLLEGKHENYYVERMYSNFSIQPYVGRVGGCTAAQTSPHREEDTTAGVFLIVNHGVPICQDHLILNRAHPSQYFQN